MRRGSDLALVAILFVAVCSGCSSEVAKDVTQASPTNSPNSDEEGGNDGAERVDFVQHILPILQRSCFPCHGPKMSPISMAGFRVDLQEHTVGRGKIVPGDPDESVLIKRLITKQDSKRMPPLKSDNPQLNDEEIELLRRWIKQGASYGTQ